MSGQNYDNHTRLVAPFHFVLLPGLLLGLIGSCVNLYHSLGDPERIYSASLLVLVMLALMMTALFGRGFALKAQDRAIKAEENLRHYVLTGKLLDPHITVRQIIGLRFAPDEEFVQLAARAAKEGLGEKEIKQAVKNWRADEYRV
jgi:hypothetical protein